MSSFEPLTIRAMAKQANLSDLASFREAVGLGALVGSLPVGTDEWAYHTELRSKFSPAMPGIELESSVVFPLRKTQSTFKGTVLIGRASSNDICIPHPSISKLHARIRGHEGAVFISDAGSSNGTEVGGAKISEEVPLRQGSYIDMGDCSFIFYEVEKLYEALRQLKL